MDKRRSQGDLGDDNSKCCRTSDSMCSVVSNGQLDQDKRIRRAVANCNERRRMQSINAGFDTLRLLLSPTPDSDKMSKATILQMTAKYINELVARVSVLENEVAVYRQPTACHTTGFITASLSSPNAIRKRRSDEHEKCPDLSRSRQRVDSVIENPGVDYASCSPNSCETHQNSPSNSFVSSASVSPTSPHHDSGSSTAARLEHLVMAIEQIEGGGAQISCHNESITSDDRSPPISGDSCWQGHHGSYSYTYSTCQGSSLKPITSFTDSLMLSSVTDITTITSPADECKSVNHTTTDYPIVAKLLNRPIPHKYLHRPQVVVNSFH